MTVLHSIDFFASSLAPIAIETRAPQTAFPEHHHDFYEIVIVEEGRECTFLMDSLIH